MRAQEKGRKRRAPLRAPRGLLFRELSLWWERKLLPCERLEIHEAQVMDGTARKSPFPPAAFVGAPLVVAHQAFQKKAVGEFAHDLFFCELPIGSLLLCYQVGL